MGDPTKEPTAQERANARATFGMFNAFVLEGFTEQQALQIIGQMLAAAVLKGGE